MTEPGQRDRVPEHLGPRTARRLEFPGGAEEARRDEEHRQADDLQLKQGTQIKVISLS